MVASVDASVAQQSPSAQLVLVVDDIGAGKTKSALQRLKATDLGAINADLSGFLTAWLTAAENIDKGVAALAQLPPRRMLAGEQAAIQGLMYLGAGRDEKAIEAFDQAQRLPLAATDLGDAAQLGDHVCDARELQEHDQRQEATHTLGQTTAQPSHPGMGPRCSWAWEQRRPQHVKT